MAVYLLTQFKRNCSWYGIILSTQVSTPAPRGVHIVLWPQQLGQLGTEGGDLVGASPVLGLVLMNMFV